MCTMKVFNKITLKKDAGGILEPIPYKNEILMVAIGIVCS